MSLQIKEWLGTAYTTAAGSTAVEVFASPSPGKNGGYRTGFLASCCDSTATDVLYISDKSDISATNYWYAILASDPQPQYIPWPIGTKVYVLGSTAAVSLRMQEVRVGRHPQ